MMANFIWLIWIFPHLLQEGFSIPLDYGDSSLRNDSWAHRAVSRMFLLDRLPQDAITLPYCRRNATCQPLSNTTCLGAKLPYSMTTLELVPTLTSPEQITEHFTIWRGLIHLPRCWAVIQPFLCSLYFPKCENNMVDLPSQEMCKILQGPACRILTEMNAWPMALRCNNTTDFPSSCKNDVRELKFNTTGRCREPMVPTDSPGSYYDGMDGCGVQCDNPMFTPDERYQIHRLVAWSATTCFLFNLFTVVTFMIDWKSSSKYPALVIFYINLCFLIVCLGWLAQFLPGGREDIVCRKDGTLRVGEPNARENLSCVVVFVLVYYFLMAGIVWFVILTYAYHISFQALGKIQERMDKKGAYFHLVAWSLPLVLTITTMALGEIDGNSVSGVCFVGSINHVYRAIFVLVPVFAALAVGGFFLFKGLLKLIRLKISSQEIISERASAKIRETIMRMGFFSVLIFIFGFTTFACHIYEFRNSPDWHASFRKYIVCRLVYETQSQCLMDNRPSLAILQLHLLALFAMSSCRLVYETQSQCLMDNRPSLAILQLHLLALFATGIAMSSWVWTNSTVQTWKRFFARLTNKTPKDPPPVKLKKHKVIAQAYTKRQMLNSKGRLSISIHSTHQDPVGLNFELNSMASGNLSSTWAAALPKLVTRRGALVGGTNSNSSQRRNSMDSEISYSVRRVSVESRRHSLDSAVSVQVAELTKTVRKARPSHQRQRRRKRSRNVGSRRNSSTSQESQMDAQIFSALTIGKVDIPPLVHNQNRRDATSGLNDSLNVLAEKLFGNLAGPLGLSQESEGSSEEEVTQVRETLITGRVHTNTNTNTNTYTYSYCSDEEKNEEEEEEDDNSDDASQPLTKNYKNKNDTNIRLVKMNSKNHKSLNESENEEDGKYRKSEGRHSKLSNKSDTSRMSRRTFGSDSEKRLNKQDPKRDKLNYPSCSDLENCTDDAKWIQSEGEGKGSSKKVNVAVSTDCSLSPDQLHYTYQSTSAVSVGSNPYHGREIGTQTNVSFNNRDRCSSAGSKPKRKKSNASRNKPSSTDSSMK